MNKLLFKGQVLLTLGYSLGDTEHRNQLKSGSNRVSKVISELLWFCITSIGDWFKVLALVFHPIRSETKTNRSSRVQIFPRFVSATCNYFEF